MHEKLKIDAYITIFFAEKTAGNQGAHAFDRGRQRSVMFARSLRHPARLVALALPLVNSM